MKRLTLLTVLGFIGCMSLSAFYPNENLKQGTINYEIKISGKEEMPETMIEMFQNSSMTFMWSKNRSLTKMDLGHAKVDVISNGKKALMLMNMMNQKYASKMTKEELKKYQQEQKGTNYSIEKTDQTREIAGYTCKKAIMKLERKNKTMNMDYWYTNKIQAPKTSMQYAHGDIKGFPLMMEFNRNKMKMQFKATSIDQSKPARNNFNLTIPDGYTEKSLEELKQMRGQ